MTVKGVAHCRPTDPTLTPYNSLISKRPPMTDLTHLTEDNVSDLLWLVNNYGHKLTEVIDNPISANELTKLTETLEAMLNEMG